MEKPRIIVEFGALDEVDRFRARPEGKVDASFAVVDAVKKRIGDKADVIFWPYDSIATPLCGGRSILPIRDISTFQNVVKRFSDAGLSFSLPMNGGLLTMSDGEVDEIWNRRASVDRQMLDCVADGVSGVVTIAHDRVLELVERDYPNLIKVASCKRYLQKRRVDRLDAYRRDAARFHHFVPLNQDTKLDVLTMVRELGDRMVIFLNLGCDRANTDDCREHYLKVEKAAAAKDGGRHHMTDDCRSGSMLNRMDKELSPIVRDIGVRGFKFARYTGLSMGSLEASQAFDIIGEALVKAA